MERISPLEPISGIPATLSPFAPLLREYRVAAGLTQEALAARSGISVRAISDLERGIRRRPQRATMQLLADGLGLTAIERAALGAAVPNRHPPPDRRRRLDMPVGGFLGSVPERPLVARACEIERIRGVVETVRAGEGRLLLLSGEPGVGKTRLAQEVTLICQASNMYLAAGRCYTQQQPVALYPFLEILSCLVTAARAGLGIEPLQRWPQLGSVIPEGSQEGRAHPALSGAPLDGEGDQQRLFWAVAGLIEILAESGPAVVALDDLQWADQSSLDLLHHLARRLRQVPVLLLGTYRDEEVGRHDPLSRVLRDLHREQLAEEISVGRLSREGTRDLMVSALSGSVPAPAFVDLVHRHTDGNAFFIQEVVRALVERGDAFQQNGVWESRGAGEIAVPRTVQEAIGERLARLSERAQTILSEASVLGETFEFDDLQLMGARSEEEIEAALGEAARAGLVRVGERDSYAFNHVLTHRVLYHDLLPRRRRRLHRAAGKAIERQPERIREQRAAELARHFLEGGEPDRALRYTIMAGDQAAGRFAHREAEQRYRVALELARGRDEPSTEATLLMKLGNALSAMDRYNEALDALHQAAATAWQANDVDAELRAAAHIGRVHADRGTTDEGIGYTQRILSALEGVEISPAVAALYATLASLYFAAGHYREQHAAAKQAATLAGRFGNDEVLAAAEVRRGSALALLGQEEQALAALREAIPLANRVEDLVSLHRALTTVAEIYRADGRFDQSRQYRERALEVARRLSSPSTIAFSMATLGRVHVFQGNWDAAEALLEEALSLAASTSSWFTAYPALHLGELRLGQGAWDEASELLEMAVIIAQRSRDMQALRFAHQALAKLDLLHGRPEAARERLEPLLDRPGLAEVHVTGLLAVFARVQLALGDAERAERLLTEALNRAANQNTRLAALDARRTHGIVLSRLRRWPAAERSFEQAICLARAMPYPYAEARILYQMGLMERERAEPLQARDCLTRALVIFQRLGARAYGEQTEQALATLVSA